MTGSSTRSGRARLRGPERIYANPSPEDLSDEERRRRQPMRPSSEDEPPRVSAWSATATSTNSVRRTSRRALPRSWKRSPGSSRDVQRERRGAPGECVAPSSDHGRHDTRATMRRSLRSGGEVVRIMHREPTSRPRRVVLLCDVSGSMEPYVPRPAALPPRRGGREGRVEAFAVGTRLTRLTRQLSLRDPDAALSQAIRAGAGLVRWDPVRRGDRRPSMTASGCPGWPEAPSW